MADRKLDHVRRVHIGGEVLQVRSDASPETIEEVAEVVDAHVRRLMAAGSETDRFRLGVLAALHVAGELFEARSERDEAVAARDGILAKLSENIALRERAEAGRDDVLASRAALQTERDDALARRAWLEGERDDALEAVRRIEREWEAAKDVGPRLETDLSEAIAAREVAESERDQAVAALAALQVERDDALELRERMQAERDDARAQLATLQAQRDEAQANCRKLEIERDDALAVWEKAETDLAQAEARTAAAPPATGSGIIEMMFDPEPPLEAAPDHARIAQERDEARERCAELETELESLRSNMRRLLDKLEGF